MIVVVVVIMVVVTVVIVVIIVVIITVIIMVIPVWVTISDISGSSVNWGGQCKGGKGGTEKEGDLGELHFEGWALNKLC